MIIDLHNHAELSKNTTLTFSDYIKKSKEKGLSFAITEHNQLYKNEENFSENFAFTGIEILNDYGDFLVFGAPEECIEKRNDMFKLIEFVHENGGIIIAAHPFSGYGICNVINSKDANEIIKLVDAIEVYNGRAKEEECKKAYSLAREHKKPCVGGSDAHNRSELFKCGTKFAENIESIEQLVAAIKDGCCEPVLIG
ncbi:PHP domain-containing protein [Oceanirhabdus sp. W0125-5]|uniref:PHP domain-containing protein n=1 Tax=Oceanirhabdus sp. W0125-5 TaxID=2999116 RepID=UPI0022F2A589|nr:PHP domain-containing protein [Oceanirhabdus sp. W0125-5]WBW95587.1 PHP domain-containing protein [Oceanirhabdus sp. W0125-5]